MIDRLALQRRRRGRNDLLGSRRDERPEAIDGKRRRADDFVRLAFLRRGLVFVARKTFRAEPRRARLTTLMETPAGMSWEPLA